MANISQISQEKKSFNIQVLPRLILPLLVYASLFSFVCLCLFAFLCLLLYVCFCMFAFVCIYICLCLHLFVFAFVCASV
jgi:hypothetical protein